MAHQQESFLPFSSRQSLSCCLSCMVLPIHSAWTSTYLLASELRGPLLQNHMALSLSTCFRTAWSPYSLQNRVAPYLLQNRVVSLSMAAALRFKSQCPSSFAAPFLTPPTVSYTCQHPRILPALLGCHSKSGQVWPHGMEPIISKLSSRPCNQGELLPSPILGGIWSHPPGSKHGHSYLTHP